VKVIRFVPAGDLPVGDPALARALAERDPTDMPTLKVFSLIAPTVLLAADRDLRDIGLAYERWREVPEAVRRIVAGTGSTDLAARAVFGAGYVTVGVVRGLARALQRPPVAITVAVVILVAALSWRKWAPHVRRRAEQLSPPVRQALGSIGRAVVSGYEKYAAALAIWSSAQRGQPGNMLTHRAARLLATSPKPMTRTEITAKLGGDVAQHGHRAVMRALHLTLSGHQAFHEVSRGRWQLGKDSADFGGLALAPWPVISVDDRPAALGWLHPRDGC
jgi:hypothetical protein